MFPFPKITIMEHGHYFLGGGVSQGGLWGDCHCEGKFPVIALLDNYPKAC